MAKAAASMEDDPNWWEAMNCLFTEEYWKSATTEVEVLEAMFTWEVVDHSEDINDVTSTWVFKLNPRLVLKVINILKALISLKQIFLLFSGYQ